MKNSSFFNFNEKKIPQLKTSLEIVRMQAAGTIIARVLSFLDKLIVPSITTLDIAEACVELIKQQGAEPALKNYKGFPADICTSVNSVAVHGVPNNILLQNGDIVTVDVAVNFQGWFCDAAATYPVGTIGPEAYRLIKAAKYATKAGIDAAKAGNRMGDIGYNIKKTAQSFGCNVIENFIGHGIGEELHEEPAVLSFGEKDTGIPIVPGLVFTIEPVLTLGCDGVKQLEDLWTMVTVDGALTAQFEHTIAIYSNRTEILTES